MKILSCLLLALCATNLPGVENIPTPMQALTWSLNADPRPWESAYKAGNKTGLLMEFVVKGDKIESWREMYAHQIAFVGVEVRRFVDIFTAGLRRADPKIEVRKTTGPDGSVTLEYVSLSADETAIRRFLRGRDGVYMLAYHVRPKLKNPELWQKWREIIASAKLIPNPYAASPAPH